MWQVVSLLVVSSIMICGPNIYSNAKPIRGNNVKAAITKQFPFVVGIATIADGKSNTDNYICAGTLVSQRHVLTASHCVENYLEVDLRVLAGHKNLEFCTSYNIDMWEIYDNWAWVNHKATYDDGRDDIAVMRLVNAVVQPGVKAAILPPRGFSVPFHSSVQLAGWGESNVGYLSILQTATLTLKSPNDCNLKMKKFTSFQLLDEREFCTMANPYVLTGYGDSGGPVIYNGDTIIGINQGACANIPLEEQINTHVNLINYRDFIDDVMTENY